MKQALILRDSCISCLSHKEKSLTKAPSGRKFVFAHSLRVESVAGEEDTVAAVQGSWSQCSCSQDAEEATCWCSACLFIFIYSGTPACRVVLPTFS